MPSQDPPELRAAAGIGDYVSCSRQRVSQLTRHSDSPEPVLRLKMGTVWVASNVRDWDEKHYLPRENDE